MCRCDMQGIKVNNEGVCTDARCIADFLQAY